MTRISSLYVTRTSSFNRASNITDCIVLSLVPRYLPPTARREQRLCPNTRDNHMWIRFGERQQSHQTRVWSLSRMDNFYLPTGPACPALIILSNPMSNSRCNSPLSRIPVSLVGILSLTTCPKWEGLPITLAQITSACLEGGT